MRENLDESDVEGFDQFVERNWGDLYSKKQTVQASATPAKRGRKRKNEI